MSSFVMSHSRTSSRLVTRAISSLRQTQSPRSFSQSSRVCAKLPIRIDGQGRGVAQTAKVHGSTHSIEIDAYPSMGGQGASPAPLAYTLGSLSGCTQITGAIVAKDQGLTLGDWYVTVKGNLDPAVLVGGKEGNANFDDVELNVRVQTDAVDEAQFRKFVSETERRCPVTQLFRRSGAGWKSEWVNEKL